MRSRLNHSRFWVALSWLLVAARAHAQGNCVQLEGALPEALSRCATDQVVCESYQRALAADGGDTPVLPLQVRLTASGTSTLEVDVFSTGRWLGHRELSVQARDCAALPDALALVLALLARQAAAEPQPIAAAPPAPPVAEPEPAAPYTGSVSLAAGAGVFFAALPSAAFALQLQAATLGRPWSFRARGTLLWPQEQRIAEGSVRMHDYELAVEACGGFSFRDAPRLTLRVCAGPRAGVLRVHASDFTLRNESATKFFLSLGLLPELALALGPSTSLELGPALAAGLVRPRFGVALDSGERVTALSAPSWIRLELVLRLVQIF